MSSLSTPPPPLPPLPSFPSHSGNKISPIVLLVIVILAIIFFAAGVLHLLVRFLIKTPAFHSSVSQSNRYTNNSNNNSDAIQRQLQQLFRLHDSGLDQALIDALPVFYYKDITGLKEPFDCAVCLYEFSSMDKLRLLPVCSHAFHVGCIDTWLLSNSTCPLCRGSILISSGLENQEFSSGYWRELSLGCSIIDGIERDVSNVIDAKPTIMEENASERRVFSVRLGKFRGLNDGEETSTSSSSSSSQLDARRCYSLGSCQYVVDDLHNLQVVLSKDIVMRGGCSEGMRVEKMVGGQCVGFTTLVVDEDVEGKKISRRNRGDSFSVSKIWLWSKKGKFSSPFETNVNVRGGGGGGGGGGGDGGGGGGGDGSVNVVLPLSSRDRGRVLG